MFLGFFPLDGTGGNQLLIPLRTRDSAGILANATSLPTYRIYQAIGSSTLMPSGVGSFAFRDTGSITGAANNGSNAIRITSAGHGLETGDYITITGVGGVTAANNTWTITKINSSTFDLVGSSFSGSYISGGEWQVTGLYYAQHALTTANGYEKGKSYTVTATFAVSGDTLSQEYLFQVV